MADVIIKGENIDSINLSLIDYSRFVYLSRAMLKDNKVKDKKNGKALSDKRFLKILKINKMKSLKNYLSKLTKAGLISKINDNDRRFICVNPMYARSIDFEWYKEIFDLFENSIKDNLSYFEYLKIKAKFYDVNHQITVKKYEELVPKISGIYRLYKNNEIVYIGKSVCIKSRLYSHIKEKDIDSFDFTILTNESDKNIYELYYIDKYKPVLNKDCIEKSTATVYLKELVFTDKIY